MCSQLYSILRPLFLPDTSFSQFQPATRHEARLSASVAVPEIHADAQVFQCSMLSAEGRNTPPDLMTRELTIRGNTALSRGQQCTGTAARRSQNTESTPPDKRPKTFSQYPLGVLVSFKRGCRLVAKFDGLDAKPLCLRTAHVQVSPLLSHRHTCRTPSSNPTRLQPTQSGHPMRLY